MITPLSTKKNTYQLKMICIFKEIKYEIYLWEVLIEISYQNLKNTKDFK